MVVVTNTVCTPVDGKKVVRTVDGVAMHEHALLSCDPRNGKIGAAVGTASEVMESSTGWLWVIGEVIC